MVDTLGRPELGSIRVSERAHTAFEAAAIAAIVESRYRPARLKARPVRQRVRQGLLFLPRR